MKFEGRLKFRQEVFAICKPNEGLLRTCKQEVILTLFLPLTRTILWIVWEHLNQLMWKRGNCPSTSVWILPREQTSGELKDACQIVLLPPI